ncbi:HpcH/HpaI aldolase family protein [Pararhizobium haloflavum]|uniref:HpcH/HpaI aldolase family protein n=1 Tax=Pararhizobium haloflavum TaxID=2037914 RepID=UPI000C1A895D|nr:aldolase/citrate lyase family protein [Pararhizobium haloflavum]
MKLAERLRSGETLMTAWSSMASLPVVDSLARSGFDAVTLDMQHGAHDEASVHDCLQPVAMAGKGAVVRIPVGRNDMASRALDFGAEAVIAPMINSREDAKRFAAAMKYPPLGERSWGPFRALQIHGEGDAKAYMRSANDRTLAFAMIETRAALSVLADILDVKGIDGVFVGPSDFSISWSGGGDVDPHLNDLQPALEEVAAKAREKGKPSGIFVFDPARAGTYAAMGYQLMAITNDVAFLNAGTAAGLAAARGGDAGRSAGGGY